MCTLFFVTFLTLKMWMIPTTKHPSSVAYWWTPNAPELAVLKKTNLIFQRISLSNATLFSIVFFACDVHKLNYIKDDFVKSINQIYHSSNVNEVIKAISNLLIFFQKDFTCTQSTKSAKSTKSTKTQPRKSTKCK